VDKCTARTASGICTNNTHERACPQAIISHEGSTSPGGEEYTREEQGEWGVGEDAHAADDSGFGEGGGRGGGGGGRVLRDQDVPLHSRPAVAARARCRSLAGALRRFGCGFRRAARPGTGAFSKLERGGGSGLRWTQTMTTLGER
jgi:hypothetical protein